VVWHFCLFNAIHGTWTDIKSLKCLSVCPSEVPIALDGRIATAVFSKSSSNLKCRSHIRQQRLSSMASNTRSSNRSCASIYFRFCSLLGLCPRWLYNASIFHVVDKPQAGTQDSTVQWNIKNQLKYNQT